MEIHSIKDLEAYTGELKAFLGFLKYQTDKNALKTFIHDNETLFQAISPESIQAMAVLGNSRELETIILEQAETEDFNMCKALKDWAEEERESGRIEGIHEEKLNSIRIFIEDNIEESIPTERILEKLSRRFLLSPDDADMYLKKFSAQ